MASTNKNLIQSLRSAHDPHFKLEGRVEGLEKNIPIQIAQLHKTLSKSFGMQRKTLMRVLGLEKKLAELEASKEAQQEAQQEVEDVIEDVQDSVEEEIPEQLDNVLDDIRGEEEVGGDDATETTPTTSTAVKPKPKRKRLRIKKKKISGGDLKKDSSQESVEKINFRVTVNEKKIALVKNILKSQKSDLAEKLRSLESESEQQQMSSPLLETLQAIAATTDSIRDTLIQKQDFDEDIREDMRIAGEKADADKQEKGLENTNPKPLTKLGEKIIAPVTSIFGKIFNFIKTLILGKFLMNFIDWFANPANQGKIQSFVRFIGDWWPALTAAVLLFGTGFTGLVAGLVKVIVFGVTKLLGLIPLLKAALVKLKAGKLLSLIPGGKLVKGALLLGGTALTAYGVNKVMSNDEGMGEDSEEFQEFNKGGQVPGSGPNKDTVPAMLTPGEFVMTRGAVQKYGTDTLEGMNAAAGGTNQSTFSKGKSGFNEGGKAFDKSHYGTRGYRIGQINPPTLLVSRTSYTSKAAEIFGKGGGGGDDYDTFSEDVDMNMPGRTREVMKYKEGELVGKETFEEDIAAIGVPDLLEHKDQLLSAINAVEGYENVTIDDVINRKVNMPLKDYIPILMNSDAQAATFAKMDAATQIDMQARGITDPSKGFSMSINDGGSVQHFNRGGLVQKNTKGNDSTSKVTPKKLRLGGLFGGGKKEGGSSGILGSISSNVDDMVDMEGYEKLTIKPSTESEDTPIYNKRGRIIGYKNDNKYDIKSKEPKNTIIAYEQEVNKNQQQKTAPASGGNEIPSFDVAPIRDPHKMTTLQIVLF